MRFYKLKSSMRQSTKARPCQNNGFPNFLVWAKKTFEGITYHFLPSGRIWEGAVLKGATPPPGCSSLTSYDPS